MGRRLTQEEFVAKVKEVHGGKFTVKGTYGGRLDALPRLKAVGFGGDRVLPRSPNARCHPRVVLLRAPNQRPRPASFDGRKFSGRPFEMAAITVLPGAGL